MSEGEVAGVGLQLRLPAQRLAPSTARRALMALTPYLTEDMFHHAELLLSELVTNSVRHAGVAPDSVIDVAVTIDGLTVHIEVADCGNGFDDSDLGRREDRTGGYGLFLVDELARDWGVRHGDMSSVWFELTDSRVGAQQ